jgi:hypothetical protein
VVLTALLLLPVRCADGAPHVEPPAAGLLDADSRSDRVRTRVGAAGAVRAVGETASRPPSARDAAPALPSPSAQTDAVAAPLAVPEARDDVRAPRPAPAGQLDGTLRRRSDLSGLHHAQIVALGPEDAEGRATVLAGCFTERDGTFAFADLDPTRPPTGLKITWLESYVDRSAEPDFSRSSPTGRTETLVHELPATHAWWTGLTLTLDTGWILYGRVTDSAGAPVHRALVHVGLPNAETGPDGRFRLRDVRRGPPPVPVVVRSTAHAPLTLDISPPREDEWIETLDVVLVPDPTHEPWRRPLFERVR